MGHMWKVVRISVLLFILVVVAQRAWLEGAGLDWKSSFRVTVHPINVDGNVRMTAYIRSLQSKDFETVATFFAAEGARYHLQLRRPVEVSLGAEVRDVPPAPPRGGGALSVGWWSLRFRYFAWRHSPTDGIRPHVRLYLLFHDPRKHSVLGHSTALSKGRIGRVNQFGGREYHQQNLVILSHELLHTLKATDQYDPETTLPTYPDGYAEPDRVPRHPQELAELMGGRVPLSEGEAEIPGSLRDVVIGEMTAREIRWIR